MVEPPSLSLLRLIHYQQNLTSQLDMLLLVVALRLHHPTVTIQAPPVSACPARQEEQRPNWAPVAPLAPAPGPSTCGCTGALLIGDLWWQIWEERRMMDDGE